MFPALGQIFGDPEIGINLAGLIHGEQGFTFHEQVQPGDVVDSEATIASVDDKRGMTFVGVDMQSKRHDGTPVCSGHALLIIRAGGTLASGRTPAADAGVGEAPHGARQRADGEVHA
jgi:acyl dehydratase